MSGSSGVGRSSGGGGRFITTASAVLRGPGASASGAPRKLFGRSKFSPSGLLFTFRMRVQYWYFAEPGAEHIFEILAKDKKISQWIKRQVSRKAENQRVDVADASLSRVRRKPSPEVKSSARKSA